MEEKKTEESKSSKEEGRKKEEGGGWSPVLLNTQVVFIPKIIISDYIKEPYM